MASRPISEHLPTDDKPHVTAVISHLVKLTQTAAYEQWLRDISAVAQQFEGHCGVDFIQPQDSTYPEYAIILKFDSYQNLKQWMDSPVRQKWLDKAQPLVQQDQTVKLVKQPPKRYKMAILTTLSVFTVAQILGCAYRNSLYRRKS